MSAELKRQIQEYGLESLGVYYGVYRGFIVKNEDPEFLGRVQLQCPQVWGEDQTLDYWAYSKGMYCGTGIGMFAIPNIGDMVWISFEGGNPRFPVWEYGHFAKPNGTSDVPSDWKNNGNKPTKQVWQSTSGHRIELDDKDGSEVIRITNKHGYNVELNKNGVSTVVPSGKKINLGTLDNAAEPAVLGDKNEDALETIRDMLQKIIQMLLQISVSDALGTSILLSTWGITLNYPTTMATTAGNLAGDLASLIGQIPLTKSNKVKLD